MKNINKYISLAISAILFIAGIVSLWFLLGNIQALNSIGTFAPIFIVATAVIIIINFFPHKSKSIFKAIVQRLTNMSRNERLLLLVAVAVLSLLIRYSFLLQFEYKPVSDPGQFYKTAKLIADGTGIEGRIYQALFPYLTAYNNVLAISMKIFSNPWVATVSVNSLFDILSSTFIYLLIQRLKGPKSTSPTVAFSLWMLSPFSILYSILSLPIPVVNFFIFLGLYIFAILIDEIRARNLPKTLLLSILAGTMLGIANCFRPVFPVFLIALFIFLLYLSFTNIKELIKVVTLSVVAFLIILSLFLSIQKLNTLYVSSATGINAPTNGSGWTIFVGANYKHNGGWNKTDSDYLYTVLEKHNNNIQSTHDQLAKEAKDRYKSYGVLGTANLMGRKLYKFARNQNVFKNIDTSVIGYSNSIYPKIFNLYILVFTTLVFSTTSYYLINQSQLVISNPNLSNPTILMVSLIIIGFFLSSALVEVSHRYAQIMYPLFISVSAILIGKKLEETL